MNFDAVYYEPDALQYDLGRMLKSKYSELEWIAIYSHNNIEALQQCSNSEFTNLKKKLIIGIRKTHKYVENSKCSDYLVPYTSSGCTAMCLYCYLVCNYNKCSYMRLFVNREQMMDKIIKVSNDSDRDLTLEIGSNSDLILENTITDNLTYTIERFAEEGKGFITFPTKFHYVDSLLSLNHKEKTIIRMSVNPEEIIREVELKTSRLDDRIDAVNKLSEAGYPIGILIAPVVITPEWRENYMQLLNTLYEKLSDRIKKTLSIEIIYMTYSYIHRAINNEAFPNAIELYDKSLMGSRGYGKYSYKGDVRHECEDMLKGEIGRLFGLDKIAYIV